MSLIFGDRKNYTEEMTENNEAEIVGVARGIWYSREPEIVTVLKVKPSGAWS